jgi:methionyl-tRNA synthetase
MSKFLITSALPYANAPLHFGHIAGAYLPGDVYARFQRAKKQQVLYICGSDEYGVAITMSADLAGRTPKEHVDIFHEMNKKLFAKLNFSFDHYSRTTWEGHAKPVQEFFLDLYNNGFIEARDTDQLYSENDKKFLADRYVIGTCPRCKYDKARGDECPKCGASFEATDLISPRSKMTNAPLTRKKTRHWFLLLDKKKEELLKWLGEKQWKPNVVNFIREYINHLHPRAITRDSSWGIPVPLEGTEGKVLYVWFDAPIGYISATQEWALKKGQPEEWKHFWLDPKVKLVNFIGKDNIPFHASIFPAMVMGQNTPYKLVDELPANEFYNLEGRKFSKSEGWSIDFEDFLTRYTVDQIRYMIAATAPESADSEFTWKEFQSRCNQDLAGKLGNFIHRTLTFAHKFCNGTIPAAKELEEIDTRFISQIDTLFQEIGSSFEGFRVRKASQLLMELAQAGNVYFDHKQPWKDAKVPELKTRMETTIALCIRCIKALSVAAAPIIPESAEKIWKMIDEEGLPNTWEEGLIPPKPGQALLEPQVLFAKVEDEQIQGEIDRLHRMLADAASTAEA